MKDFQRQANKLLKVATRQNIDPYRALDYLLDYLIGTFEMDNIRKFAFNYEAMLTDAKERNEELFSLLADWFMDVTDEMENGKGFLDWFGTMYEALFQGKSKASALGQFYTPESLCTAMARCIAPEGGRYNDCACGSGRTLLAAFAETPRGKFQWYEAGDVDYISCKMCALNMMIHGMVGTVKQQDALLLSTPHIIYHVNEVRYPLPTAMYSIRAAYPKKEDKHTDPPKKKKEPIQLSLFE